MELGTRTAHDQDGNNYQIQIPSARVVEQALLELDYSQGAIRIGDAAQELADRFCLTDEQRNASRNTNRQGSFRIFNHHVSNVAGDLVDSGQLVRPKNGWIISSSVLKDMVDGFFEGLNFNAEGVGDLIEDGLIEVETSRFKFRLEIMNS